jgi:hypothetical protein
LGLYYFEDIIPGNYFVQFDLPTELYKRSPKDVDQDDARDSDANVADGFTETFTIVSGYLNNNIDAGFYRCSYIGDFVWLDIGSLPNIQDLEDEGLDGIVINLLSATNPNQIISAVTSFTSESAPGFYQFEVCDVGNYFIRVEAINTYDFVVANMGNDETDSNITDTNNGESEVFAIDYAVEINNIDIGFRFKPLPIELLNFVGHRNKEKNTNDLEWTTSSEINTDYFEIVRSVNGAIFETIGKKQAQGNSTTNIKYELTDKVITTNGSYIYKLISFDFDGKSVISKPVVIEIDDYFDHKIKIYPNPANHFLEVQFFGELGHDITLEIFDIIGNSVLNHVDFNGEIESRTNQQLDLNNLPSGSYFLKVIFNEYAFIEKFMVQK